MSDKAQTDANKIIGHLQPIGTGVHQTTPQGILSLRNGSWGILWVESYSTLREGYYSLFYERLPADESRGKGDIL